MHKKRLEIVQLVERRRKWPVEAKARIMEEALAADSTIASMLDRVDAWISKSRLAHVVPMVENTSSESKGKAPPAFASSIARLSRRVSAKAGNGTQCSLVFFVRP